MQPAVASGRHWLVCIVAIAAADVGLDTTPAWASPPKQARIVEGRSMAGVALMNRTMRTDDNTAFSRGILASWGPVYGFCFEGTHCQWKVPGGGWVLVILGRMGRVERLQTDARRWKTARGIGPGTPVTRLRRRYRGRLRPITACALDGFGEDNQKGLILRTRVGRERRYTIFEIRASSRKISAVWIGRGRPDASTSSC